MKNIEFDNQEKEILVTKIKNYFESELNQDIGQFDAEFLIDFFSANIGAYYYNRGLSDARVAIQVKLDDLESEIENLEKPTDFIK